MILTDQQEQLSLAVLHATCARAGFGFHISGRIQDNWGWDAHADVKERFEPTSTLFNFRLRFQLKATRQQQTIAVSLSENQVLTPETLHGKHQKSCYCEMILEARSAVCVYSEGVALIAQGCRAARLPWVTEM